MCLLTSCKTLSLTALSPTGKNEKLLPPLGIIVDEPSFASALGATTSASTGSVYTTSETGGIVSSSTKTYSNPLIQYIITIYERDILNISDTYGDQKGYAKCRLITGSSVQGGYGLAFLSGFTLLVPNLFGMPFANHKSTMQIEVSIYDNEERLVGKYLSNFKSNKVPIALYGYGEGAAEIYTVITTFKECMNDIKLAIADDYDRLAPLLK